MKKILSNVLLLLIMILISVEVLIESADVLESVKFSFNIWENSIFPSLFPFFVIGNILIDLGFPKLLGTLLKDVMYKLFKINGTGAFIIILSILSGFPSSAKYTKELYLNGEINDKEATKLLTFTHFSNPLFILGTLSITFLNNKEIGMCILISHYIGNLFIGLIFRNYYISKKDTTKVSLKNAIISMNSSRTDKSFGQMLSNAITSSISTLLLILGTVTIFLVLTTLINNNLSVSPYYKSIINGIFEMTQGLKYLSMLKIPLYKQALISVFFISFGGLSVHMQVLSIISDTKIKYFPYFISRILHASISTIIFFIWKVL
ncbi:sporulation integral membrane protein YlbJ [Clostridium sp. CAG:1193]|nr:sporulation integral membrane protein YlbJ [Clostridium sp. CAG:1193]